MVILFNQAIGASCDMLSTPAIALMIGVISGIISAFGMTSLNPFLVKKLKLHDTCGVHFIHGIPSVIAWISSSIIAASVKP